MPASLYYVRTIEPETARAAFAFITTLATIKRSDAVRTVLLIILILLLIGALPLWPYSTAWGYYPSTGLGTILVIIIILAVAGVV